MSAKPPAVQDVPQIFSDDRVRQLAVEAKLPVSDDELPGFAKSIRASAVIYIRDTTAVSNDNICREIEAMHRAADRGDGEKAAELVRDMSKATRAFIMKRAIRIGSNILKPSAFRDPARQRAACDKLRGLLSQGGHREEGKWVPHLYLPKRQLIYEQEVQQTIRRWIKAARDRGVSYNIAELRRKAIKSVKGVEAPNLPDRANGYEPVHRPYDSEVDLATNELERARQYVGKCGYMSERMQCEIDYFTQKLERAKRRAKRKQNTSSRSKLPRWRVMRPPKRRAVRNFIMFLQVDYYNATGRMPPVTASKSVSRSRDPAPGPFARFAERCLDLLGADKIDVVEQINELRRRARNKLKKKRHIQNAKNPRNKGTYRSLLFF
jgi:hypothetical protein